MLEMIEAAETGRMGPGKRTETLRRIGAAAVVSFFALSLPLCAIATPLDVFFQGVRPDYASDTAFGIGLAQAEDARDNFGIPILTDLGSALQTPENLLAITQPPSSGLTFSNNTTGGTSTANSNWGVQNISGASLVGQSYLLFTHTDPFNIGSQTIDYVDENVGITIDGDDGWVIIQGTDGIDEFYYPALLLGSSTFGDGEVVDIDVNYVVNGGLQSIDGMAGFFALPELEIGFANAVPEPSAALLFGMGLAALASSRNRRNA